MSGNLNQQERQKLIQHKDKLGMKQEGKWTSGLVKKFNESWV